MGALRLMLAAFTVLLLGSVAACGADADTTGAAGRTVTPSEARNLIADGATVIDVRTPEEFDQGHVRGALNLNIQDTVFFDQLEDLDVGDSFVVYCRSGSRAATAIEQMVERGFVEVVNAGGYDALESAGVPVE